MAHIPNNSYPSDIRLLLRCHGEQLFLASQVVPVVRQLEEIGAIADEEIGAALAYLEVLWIDACERARETEAAFAALLQTDAKGDRLLHAEACQYHAAVRALRGVISQHVQQLIAPAMQPPEPSHQHQHATF
jgi:hypothetical protein